jgi:excisionase family DNA binding protein
MSTSDKTLTVEEAGRVYFGLCKASAYRAVDSGQIPVIKIGRLLRVPIAALERMMEEPPPLPPKSNKAGAKKERAA